MGLVRAILIGVALTAGMFIIPVLMALLFPLFIFACIVCGAWILLQVLKDEG